MAGMVNGFQEPVQNYVTTDQLGKYLDDWYAKKQGLQQSAAAPNQEVYTPSYGSEATTTQSTGTTPAATQQPAQRQDYGWRPQQFMGGYGMQTPFSGYGMMNPYMGGYGGGYYPTSGFGMGGIGYGQMYSPFSMY